LYALLEDLLMLKSGTPELVRNADIRGELGRLSQSVDFEWIVTASQRLAEGFSSSLVLLLRGAAMPLRLH